MNASRLLLAALLFCMFARGAAADTLPDSQTIRDRQSAASGPVPDAYRQVIEFNGTAGSGTSIIYKRGADRREVDGTGAVHTEFGVNAGHRWHENENGHVVIDENDPGQAKREQFTTTVTRVSAPVDAYVISSLNVKGFGTREYFDPQTWYEVRHESLTPNGTIATVYNDFKAFGTRHLAGHWHVDDATTDRHTDYVNREYVAGDVSDADVAIPEIKRPLVEYPAGTDRVVLPAVFEPDGHVVVRLVINGRGLDFLLDSGASNITLDTGIAHQLGLTVLAKGVSSANAGRFDTGLAEVPDMSIGSLHMHDTFVQILPMAAEESGARGVGLLGFDFLCESGITIDYEHKQVIAQRYGTYSAPQGARVIALDTRLGSQVPLISVNINGAIAERIMLDTGGAGPFMLFDYFQRRHPEALPPSLNDRMMKFNGAGGQFTAETVDIANFKIGNIDFTRFTGFRTTSGATYSHDFDGIIGPDFLRIFDVHLDYPNGMIYLVPNATGEKVMR